MSTFDQVHSEIDSSRKDVYDADIEDLAQAYCIEQLLSGLHPWLLKMLSKWATELISEYYNNSLTI